jgi:hypothetical protein
MSTAALTDALMVTFAVFAAKPDVAKTTIRANPRETMAILVLFMILPPI